MNTYTTITERILKQLEAGVIPWHKTWSAGLPQNLLTGKEYRGINILALGLEAFSSRYWVTYRQALQLGGHVRRGERATAVIYWKWRTPEELEHLEAKTGKANLAPCHPFTSAVFNLDQVEGIARPDDETPNLSNRRMEIAERMLSTTPKMPEIVHARTNEPAYNLALDRITLPHLTQFDSVDEYYATLFHELIHASGARHRLNRFAEAEGDRRERYSFEELVAEFGGAFLCGFAGITNPKTEALQASYIQGWATVLRQDPRMILKAASAAQRAADYVRGKLPIGEPAAAEDGRQKEAEVSVVAV